MVLPDARKAAVVAVQNDPALTTEEQRVAEFVSITGTSRATYFRAKASLGRTS
jgi:hypothetical protein